MSKLRTRLENYVVRSTGDIVDDLPDERRTELAEVLHELEGYSPRAAEAEERTDELVAKRVRIAERERHFRAELEARELELTRRIEAVSGREREVRHADTQLSDRERSLGLRESTLDTRAHELAQRSDERLREREAGLDEREAKIEAAEHATAEAKHTFERRQVE